MTTATHPPRLLHAFGPTFEVPDGVTPACREDGVDPEWFFPIGDHHYADEGRDVCRRCPIEQKCGDWAIGTGERYGLYGGLDPAQRGARRRAWGLTT